MAQRFGFMCGIYLELEFLMNNLGNSHTSGPCRNTLLSLEVWVESMFLASSTLAHRSQH